MQRSGREKRSPWGAGSRDAATNAGLLLACPAHQAKVPTICGRSDMTVCVCRAGGMGSKQRHQATRVWFRLWTLLSLGTHTCPAEAL